jgi:hypothetical protein
MADILFTLSIAFIVAKYKQNISKELLFYTALLALATK